MISMDKIKEWINLGYIQKSDDMYQIRSQTNKDKFYVVFENKCECKGFRFRQDCFHLKVKEEFCKSQ